MDHIIIETLLDTIKAIPFLFICYLLLEYISSLSKKKEINLNNLNKFGPFLGAVAGLIPQCGFSTAAAALYNEGAIKAGTLIAVFLATSDEALPIMLTDVNALKYILPMLIFKFIFGVVFGYILNYTLFKKEDLNLNKTVNLEFNSCEIDEHHHKKSRFLVHALQHTFKTALYLLITMLVINTVAHFLTDTFIKNALLKGSFFSPFITALAGLIPGCSVSVLITELLIKGNITFAAGISGLCSGAGFGYVMLFKNKNKKKSVQIILLCYFISVIIGLILTAFKL